MRPRNWPPVCSKPDSGLPWPSHLLIHQRLNSGHDRGSKRSSPRAGPSVWWVRARRAAARGIRKADHVVVAPESVRGEQRYVGKIPHAIARNTGHPGLPGRFGVSLTTSSYHADWPPERRLRIRLALRYLPRLRIPRIVALAASTKSVPAVACLEAIIRGDH